MENYSSSKIDRELVKTKIWSAKSAYLGEKAGFKCEYCGRDLLQYYFGDIHKILTFLQESLDFWGVVD